MDAGAAIRGETTSEMQGDSPKEENGSNGSTSFSDIRRRGSAGTLQPRPADGAGAAPAQIGVEEVYSREMGRGNSREGAVEEAAAEEGTAGGNPPPPLPSRTTWTRRVPHPVLIGHAASLTPY